MSQPVLPPAAIDYPDSDGKPLAENDAQLLAILYAVGALGLELRAKGEEMHFHDPATGRALLSHAEEHAARREEATARRAAELRAEREAAARRDVLARAEAAEARVTELEARLREGR